MVSRMNGRTREKKYCEMADIEGEYCHLCGALPTERQLVIHHKDNNNYNNDISNITLLCRTCNYNTHPRMAERPVALCESSNAYPTALSVNRMKERGCRKYILEKMINNNSANYKRLIVSSAEFMNISPVTTKRYLDKMCSDEGILKRSAGVVQVKQNWDKLVSLTDLEIINEIKETNEQLEQAKSGDD